MAATVGAHQPQLGSINLQPLPYKIDTACPITLPTKPVIGSQWPFLTAGPALAPEEPIAEFIRRRYLETLYLSDLLAPLSAFVIDIMRIKCDSASSPAIAEIIQPTLLSLSEIETRQRRTLSRLISAIIAASSSTGTSTAHSILDETAKSSGLSSGEVGAVKVGVELRLASRAASEGANVSARKLAEEFERREVLMQIILLFLYTAHAPPPTEKKEKKRKRHSRKDDAPSPPAPVHEDPKAAVELLMDRLSVWQAVAELGIGSEGDVELVKGNIKPKDGEGMLAMFRQVWDKVLVPFFLDKQTDLCALFHTKVFGQPIPAKLLLAITTTKVSRKPKLTRARPSSNALAPPDIPRERSRVSSESLAVEPNHMPNDQTMRRSMSRTSDQRRRSRSRSIDHGPKDLLGVSGPPAKKALIRAPSGKDLFRGREVGLFRRTTSGIVKPQRENSAREESQSQRSGLLGRKTSDGAKGHARRNSTDESQSQKAATTIIFATPAKPRGSSISLFGPRPSFQTYHPTPIQEEPQSDERIRPRFIAETPHAPGRVTGSARIAETPQVFSRLASLPLSGLGNTDEEEEDEEDDDDDPLAELMVMTDEEDEEPPSRAVVPDTPAR
ncbi:hypothetical protein BCR39DRAFT_512485 [Naematelia encephala]|uniref:DNA replication regulator Sld3 C-terminal domain-containing protein n=1 Tax=Naematelia encephala TaxID=71784 RepID=A0A1Y2BM47_9TREE|nr:hypothetical protein BCR39DRAFT_512485 [Naematelia encephala]